VRKHLPGEGSVGDVQRLPCIGADDQGDAALSAQRPLVEFVLGHTVFCSATETPDDHIVEMGMASAARRPVVQPVLWNAVLRTAVEAPYNHLLTGHVDSSTFSLLLITRPRKVNRPLFFREWAPSQKWRSG